MCDGFLSSGIRKNRDKLPKLPMHYNDNFVEQLKEYIPHLEELRFNGGEPFLHKIVHKICMLVSEINPKLQINMATNGMVYNKRVQEILDKCDIRMNISIDGFTKETYEKVRLGAKYETTLKNIERFIEIKKQEKSDLPMVGVNFCKTKFNEHEEEDFIAKWIDKADFFVIQDFQPPDLDKNYSEFLPSKSIFRENIQKSGYNCQQPWQRVLVRSNGEVCPCCAFFSEELSLGNLKDHNLHELWNSKEMHDLRDMHKRGNYEENSWCKKCINHMGGNYDDSQLIQIKKP